MKVLVVVNPAAGGGRMGRRWPAYEAALVARFGPIRSAPTGGRGRAGSLVRDFAADGAEVVVAAGGDGTVSEVADALLWLDPARRPALAVIPVGTGSDFAAALGLPGDPDAAADAIATRPGRRIDAGRVLFTDENGHEAQRHFVSVASLGLSGMVDRAVNGPGGRLSRFLPGRAMFFAHALWAFATYRFPEVTVSVDGEQPITARIALAAIANNPIFGGGMRIAPGAVADDGRFEIVIARATTRLGMMRQLPLVYSGAHRRLASCTFLSGTRVTVAPLGDEPVWLDLDGESPGRLPATFDMLPAALEVRGSTRAA